MYKRRKETSRMTKVLVLVGVVFLGAVMGLGALYGGLFNVSALWEDPPLVHWVLNETRIYSVKTRAASIEVPARPTDVMAQDKQIEEGFRSYREMCAICHTPPGQDDSPTAQGLNPKAPDLTEHVKDLSEAELFWVTKNGVRMTGMPAWGPTHGDEELWNLVFFLKTLPDMSYFDYLLLDQEAAKGHSHPSGGHGDGGHDEGGGHGEDAGHDDDGGHGDAGGSGKTEAHEEDGHGD